MALSYFVPRTVLHTFSGQTLSFEISDEDRTSASYYYYGYLSQGGEWLIQRFDLTTPDVIVYRYASGRSGYDSTRASWAGLTYVTFAQVSL